MEPKRTSLRNLMGKKRWLWAFLPFAAFLALWGFCEIYDHVPKRSWFYRQTHTIALIDVTAKLEIDGEPLTLTRTIRCIRQPPVRGLARNWAAPDDMAVFDAVDGVTRTGRTFILRAPKACEAIFFNPKNRAFSDMLNNEHLPDAPRAHGPLEPVSYNSGDLIIPIIYELVGARRIPEKIIAYLSVPELMITGSYGVKFVDLTIARSNTTFRMFDGVPADRLDVSESDVVNGSGRVYTSYPVIEWPRSIWEKSSVLRKKIESCSKPCVIRLDNMLTYNLFGEAGVGLNRPEMVTHDIAKHASSSGTVGNTATVESRVFDTEYSDHALRMVPERVNILTIARIPRDISVVIDGRMYDKYNFYGDIRPMAQIDVLYVSKDGQVLEPLQFGSTF